MNSEKIDDIKPSTPKSVNNQNGTIEDMIRYETRPSTNNIIEID